jgi:hypothetical protein
LGASRASAQEATFHLPFRARWGTAVLGPGNYTLSTPDSVSGIRIFYLHSDARTQMAVPAIVSNEPVSGRSYLKLMNIDGTYYIQEYVSGVTGRVFEFAIPKASHRELSARDRVLVASAF